VYDFTKNSVLLFGGWDAMKFEFGSNEYNSLWILDSSNENTNKNGNFEVYFFF